MSDDSTANNQNPWTERLATDSSCSSSTSENSGSSNSTEQSSNSTEQSCPINSVQTEAKKACTEPNNNQIITLSNLNRFAQKIDEAASMDEQAADLVASCANAFVKDVSMRLVKLAKYRDSIPSLLDLKFTLKREYNMEFPQRRITKK